MERQDLYEKLKTLNWQQKLGNLASTLATISTRSPISKYDIINQSFTFGSRVNYRMVCGGSARGFFVGTRDYAARVDGVEKGVSC